jgi:hypothetical protein
MVVGMAWQMRAVCIMAAKRQRVNQRDVQEKI